MARSLVIVESPAKAKTLGRFLGRGYDIKASRGHVRDLPKSKFGLDVDNDFEPDYVTIKGQGTVVKELKAAAKKADRVLLATDPDREGEAISWHLTRLLNMKAEEPCRIVFHEITSDAVNKAMAEPRPVNEDLVNAQQARRILDRIVGYKLSPLLWRKIRYGLSAGRVQSVAVRLICDREQEIADFKPEEYWSLTALLATDDNEQVSASYHGTGGKKVKLESKQATDAVMKVVKKAPFVVSKVTKKERKKNPPPPFITSTLQQDAARKLGFTAKRTMAVAQQLYEGLAMGKEGSVGLITYMRTDSRRVSDAGMAQAAAFIKKRFGAGHSQARRYERTKKKNVQDAHEAIRPTLVDRDPDRIAEYLSRDQLKLYRLIWERFLSSQMKAAVYDTVSVDIVAASHLFRATGSQIKAPGFLAVYREGKDNGSEDDSDRILPPLSEGERLALQKLDPKQHFTQPPPRYTEALLVKTMEELGIGRPSTYAPTIDTIQQRGYVIMEDKRFRPTSLGKVVVDLLKQEFSEIIDVDFTAAMETKLDRIGEGQSEWRQVIGDFYGPFVGDVERAEQTLERVKIPAEETEELCDKCGQKMVIKYGRYGRFLACPAYPECKNTQALVTKTGVPCPECGKEMVGRKSKKGRTFYGCSGYPECKFVSWQKPRPDKCPECGAFMVEKRQKGKPAVATCSRPDCGHEQVKKSSPRKEKADG